VVSRGVAARPTHEQGEPQNVAESTARKKLVELCYNNGETQVGCADIVFCSGENFGFACGDKSSNSSVVEYRTIN
jgi:hypothetical protein